MRDGRGPRRRFWHPSPPIKGTFWNQNLLARPSTPRKRFSAREMPPIEGLRSGEGRFEGLWDETLFVRDFYSAQTIPRARNALQEALGSGGSRELVEETCGVCWPVQIWCRLVPFSCTPVPLSASRCNVKSVT